MASQGKSQNKELRGQQYISLSPQSIVRLLEKPHIYHMEKDDLYEIDDDALEFLTQCDGSRQLKTLEPGPDFLDFCLAEGILQLLPDRHINPLFQRPISLLSPSLRYLELQITNRCNLKCRHCYQKSIPAQDLSLSFIEKVVNEFDHLQGLKVLISGGEPLLHPQWEKVLEFLKTVRLRKVLLTNGTLITPEIIAGLRGIQAIQISLDGLQKGHEYFRGEGTFPKTMEAIRLCREEGFDVSVATMLHTENLKEIEQLSHLLHDLGVKEWGIDVPYNICASGKTRFFGLSPDQAASYLKYAYGGSFHGESEGFSCGRHLCTVMPDGLVCKCDFYADSCVGHIREGLARCWARITHIPLEKLDCRNCSHLEECGGGCRKRAESEMGADPIMCAFHHQNFPPKK